jgi:hypothetical protein
MLPPYTAEPVPPRQRNCALLSNYGSFGIVKSSGFASVGGPGWLGPVSGAVEVSYASDYAIPFTVIFEKWAVSDDPEVPDEYIEDVEEDMGPSATTVTFPDLSSSGQYYNNPKARRRFSHLGWRGDWGLDENL